MITRKGYLLLKTVIVMACSGEKSCSIRDISDRMRVPSKSIEQVLATLCKAGILSSKRGPGGGYSLLEKTNDMTLADVLDMCNEKLTFMSADYREGMKDEQDEVLAHVGEMAEAALIKSLGEFTIGDLSEIIRNKAALKNPIYAI